MKTSSLLKALESHTDASIDEQYVAVIYVVGKVITKSEDGYEAEGMTFDVIGPVADADAITKAIVDSLDNTGILYSAHTILGWVDPVKLKVNPTFEDWEMDARKRNIL